MFDQIPQPQKRKWLIYVLSAVTLLVVFAGGFFIGHESVPRPILPPHQIDLSLFWDAYNKLQENYVDPNKITDQSVLYGAIAGLAKSVGDPYTAFFNPPQAKTFQQDLAGSFDGIGAEIGLKNSQLTIIAPLKGTPAEKAGLRSGDIIVKINGKITTDMSTDDAVNLIRGKGGTTVTLNIFRQGWNQPRDLTITRGTITVPSVDWQLKDGDVAYIAIHQFDQTLPTEFQAIAMQILQSPAKKIVIDLRDDPGGYLDACQTIAGWFIKPGQVVTDENFGGKQPDQIYKTEGNGAFADYPTVVLINGGSASASEILSGALRDDRGIKLIGEQSFGKGSVQQIVPLADGQSFLKITVAKWLTPKRASISEVGLTPDIKVDITDNDIANHKDPQLEKALQIVEGK